MEDYGIEGPAIYDPSLGQTYRVSGYPTVYVLNGGGETRRAHSGEDPGEVVVVPLEEALQVSPGTRLTIDSRDARG